MGIQILGVSRLWEHHDCGGIHIIRDIDRLLGDPDFEGITIVGVSRYGAWTEYCGGQGIQIVVVSILWGFSDCGASRLWAVGEFRLWGTYYLDKKIVDGR